jgi:hypothetical protein
MNEMPYIANSNEKKIGCVSTKAFCVRVADNPDINDDPNTNITPRLY